MKDALCVQSSLLAFSCSAERQRAVLRCGGMKSYLYSFFEACYCHVKVLETPRGRCIRS